MDFDALAGSVRPASPEEAPLLREVLGLYRRALDGQFHLLPTLQEKGRRLSPATVAALDRAMRGGGGTHAPGSPRDERVVTRRADHRRSGAPGAGGEGVLPR
ncbi:hypothetical protein [Falsiroseomonas oryziterrae]|uniref:hypothetical protein n=1 Tax=Falsiroseomonas oryziterrae TaxID=2911368 RepID=UPI001F1EF915|nr:hypothetical protein [Roseomonas sp. NPKOSM-4]